MNPTMFQIMVAVLMVSASLILVALFREYLAAGSERRMMRMLRRVGLDPEIATLRDTKAIMKEVRSRCGKCPKEGLCEDWLEGEVKGKNVFCPNAPVFDLLHEIS